jgi:FAD/FMN-containing dehydrogenase
VSVLTSAVGAELGRRFRGRLLGREDAEYDEAREVYNAMIDMRPLLIARCADVADVMSAVDFAREHDLPLAVRSGGHNGAGLGTCDDGLVLDLSCLRGIRVDARSRTVRVEGGCIWGDIDHATHRFGLATPSGIISTTGVGGLTLGGGIGHLTRLLGLTIDNLLAADVVLADGRLVTTSATENADLFWAIRGGGGNFGVVTSFLFRLNPVDRVVGGPTLWPLSQAADAMSAYRDFITDAPKELNGFFAFLTVPPVRPFPPHLRLETMCGVVWCYVGDEQRAHEILAPIRELGPPTFYGVREVPYPVLQSAFDALYPPGLQWYWKAHFVKELSDAAIDVHVAHASQMPTIQSTMHLYPIDGAPHRVSPEGTAFSYRDARWAQMIVGVDPDPANADAIRTWATDYWEALHPYSAGGAYINFLMDEGQARVRASYRDNYERLLAVKRRYDPRNVFRVNQNIRAAV